jgi:mycothiol synthase
MSDARDRPSADSDLSPDLPDLTFRPVVAEDLFEIAELINVCSMEVLGTRRALIDRHGQLRRARFVPPSAEQVVVTDADGQIIGYQYLVNQPPHLVNEIGGAVHPAYRGRGIGTALLRWAKARAQHLLPLAPAEALVVLQANIFDNDHLAEALLLAEGYSPVRHWIHLAVDLHEPPPSPVLPDGIMIRAMDLAHDWPRVGPALEEAFLDHWGSIPAPAVADEEIPAEPEEDSSEEEEAEEADPYSNTRGLCFVAYHGQEVVGSCLCNAQSIEWPEAGKVGSLSIRRRYRRQGIGRALMLQAFQAFYQRGIRRIITDTDSANFTGSYRLYQDLGMQVYRRETLCEQVLRPGQEQRILTPL